MEEMLKEVLTEGEKKMGQNLNISKSIQRVLYHTGYSNGVGFKIECFAFQEVNTFKYLGTTLSGTAKREVEVKERIQSVNKACCANKKILMSKQIQRSTKIKVYKTPNKTNTNVCCRNNVCN